VLGQVGGDLGQVLLLLLGGLQQGTRL